MTPTHSPPTIALVDDDRNILTSLSLALSGHGYAVRTYHDGQSGLQGILAEPPALIILDVKMPRLDGFAMLRQLRERHSVPVIMLTSRDGEEDELQGLALGADDYIKKPFSQTLLLARIQALLRRQSAAPTPPTARLVLDDGRYACYWRGHSVPLTVTEYLMFAAMAHHPERVYSRDQLISAAYGETISVDDRMIDSHIKRIRKKFRDMDPDFDAIKTLYGAGYLFRDDA